MPDILVTENIDGDAMEALKGTFDVTLAPQLWRDPAAVREMIADCRAIVVRNQTRVDAQLIEAGKNLLVIGRAGVGLDNVDAKAASDAGIVVAFTPEQNSISVAELTIGLMLSLARGIVQADRSTRAGKWERQKFTGIELYEKTLGIVGFGRIGMLVAQRAKAFGTRVLAYDVAKVQSRDVQQVPLEELLAKSDIVSVHLPKTPQTMGLFDRAKFERMKPNTLFINTSRGEVVNEADLIRALKEKKIAGAALDVRAIEPPAASELNQMDNVILTPHIAAFTHEGQTRVVCSICHDVGAVLRGDAAKYYVNFPTPRPRRKVEIG